MGKKKQDTRSQLVKSLDFLHMLFKAGDAQSMYCIMGNNKAVAFNMILAAGTVIDEDFQACPHMGLFSAALDQCGQEYQITQLSAEKLLVRSGGFQAYIPCISGDSLSWPIPDAPLAPASDALTAAIWKVAPLVSTKAKTVLEGSIQLNNGSCIATNRRVVIEAWHGIEMPNGLLIPRIAANVLHKAKKKLVSFGLSKETLTFHFDDNTWLRTQLYQDRPMNMTRLFMAVSPRPVVPGLFEAVRKVAPFSDERSVFIHDCYVSSHRPGTVQLGSSLSEPIQGTHASRNYGIDDLNLVASLAERWDEVSLDNNLATYFEGQSLRGVITHGHNDTDASVDDDDIPF